LPMSLVSHTRVHSFQSEPLHQTKSNWKMGSSTNFHITRNKNDQELCFCWRHTGFHPNPLYHWKYSFTNLITNVKWNRIFLLIWLNTLPWNPVNLFCSVEHIRQIIFWLHATKQEHIQRFTIQQNDQKPTIVHFRPMASKVDSLGMSNTIRSVVLSYYWFLLLPFLRIEYKMIENLSLRSSNSIAI